MQPEEATAEVQTTEAVLEDVDTTDWVTVDIERVQTAAGVTA